MARTFFVSLNSLLMLKCLLLKCKLCTLPQTYKDKSLFGGIPSRRAIIHMSHQMILPMQRKLISNRAIYLQKELKERKLYRKFCPFDAYFLVYTNCYNDEYIAIDC